MNGSLSASAEHRPYGVNVPAHPHGPLQGKAQADGSSGREGSADEWITVCFDGA
ncbi:Uncharacterised protein [Chlamydia abortus]|nr:Uncharacterised protein [Chlamydia abortus]